MGVGEHEGVRGRQTTEIVDKVSDLLKLVKMSLLLLPDEIARVKDLSDDQRNAVKKRVDSTLIDLHKKMLEMFKEPTGEQQEARAEPDDEEL